MAVAERLSISVWGKGETIVTAGDVADKMYIIAKGGASVASIERES